MVSNYWSGYGSSPWFLESLGEMLGVLRGALALLGGTALLQYQKVASTLQNNVRGY
ncbi:hypothetical protein DPMN_128982 [Dreissena polymorpha]|uniref:Uncharacterized protein n=1 Tax=Dreissena polymorpha TaxID=45954 RepID=A0A9D4H431_DREPO|nr:hypothetical protein DPMN_128982 [Dreissena polymorpha]